MTTTLTSSEEPFRYDLSDIARRLTRYFFGQKPQGYLRGRTRIRNAIMHIFNISSTRAETVVEQLQRMRFIRYSGDPHRLETGRDPWIIDPTPIWAS